MRTRHRATLEDLRRAIDCLPRPTRIAMLEGIAANDIIVGAYTSGDGICPMLAAHRAGGRTSAITFARAWDRFAFRDTRSRHSRRATERELLILRSHLEASLLDDDVPIGALAAARSADEDLVAEHRSPPRPERPGDPDRAPPSLERPGDPDRTTALQDPPGSAWTRVVRRDDDYDRLLACLQDEQRAEPADPALTR